MATTRNKVMWQEGMLMRPHHFQQQQRYNDYLDNQRFRAMNDLSWGFTELTLNNELLAQGKIMIDSASGTLPDGTVFSIPDQDALPDPLHPQNFPDERSRNIYLALPVASDVRNEISDGRRTGRYRLNYADVRDLHSEEGDARTLTLGQLTPRIMSGAEDMSAYITLPLCRISDRHADGSLTLDDDFIPSCQNIQVSKKLRVYLKEVQGAIGGRASDLANRIGSPAQSGIADVAEFMMLQLLNRNQTRFTHRARRSQLHPEDFYLDLAGLLGELMTFTEPSRLPCPLDVYDHHDLTKTFKTLLPEVKRALHTVLSPRAVNLPLHLRDGIWQADKTMDEGSLSLPPFTGHDEKSQRNYHLALRGNSLNPMIDAATPLLGMVMRLSTMNSQTMPEHLFAQVVTDVQAVEQLLQEQGYEPGVIISFRYILCTFIDEAALGNGWSNKNEWIKQSLLVHFHNEAWGGEKVFILLERLIREPKRYQDLLEFLWICFSLGFRGRYKVAAQDQGEFEQIYRRLYHVLHKLRGDAPFPLLHQDKKTQGGRYQLISRLTVKHIFCGGVVVLALFYLFYLLRLDSQTQDILHQLNKLLR